MTFCFLFFGYLGVPVPFSLLAGVFVGAMLTDVSLAAIVQKVFDGVDSEALLAIPFFLLVGELMSSANVVVRIANLSLSLVGHIRGGLSQVVVTFDPNGQNLHADHIAISRYTSDAVAAASDARWLPDTGPAHVVQRLLWTTPVTVWDALRAPLRVPLAERPGVDFLIDTSAYVAEKEAALRAHVTQRPGIDRLLLATGDREAALSVEAYRLGWGPAPRARPAACLFEGLQIGAPDA
jgi:hypothetical protein